MIYHKSWNQARTTRRSEENNILNFTYVMFSYFWRITPAREQQIMAVRRHRAWWAVQPAPWPRVRNLWGCLYTANYVNLKAENRVCLIYLQLSTMSNWREIELLNQKPPAAKSRGRGKSDCYMDVWRKLIENTDKGDLTTSTDVKWILLTLTLMQFSELFNSHHRITDDVWRRTCQYRLINTCTL